VAGVDLEKVATSTDLDRIARMGMWLAAAESKSNDPKAMGMAAALRIAWAEYLGLPPYAASEIHVISGNVSLSAKGHRALAHRHGLRVVMVDETPDSCTAAVVDERSGKELGRTTYTLAQAHLAGLGKSSSGKPTGWQTNPDRMLWARASKRALDDHAPWVTVGVMSPEEFDADAVEILPPPGEDDVPFEDAD
jgi:hypothetical protein